MMCFFFLVFSTAGRLSLNCFTLHIAAILHTHKTKIQHPLLNNRYLLGSSHPSSSHIRQLAFPPTSLRRLETRLLPGGALDPSTLSQVHRIRRRIQPKAEFSLEHRDRRKGPAPSPLAILEVFDINMIKPFIQGSRTKGAQCDSLATKSAPEM